VSIQGRRRGVFVEQERPENGGRVVREVETFTCGHCSRVILVEHGAQLGQAGVGEFCLPCMSPICCGCNEEMVKTGKCVPLQKKLDAMYSRDQLFKSMGI
jgi:hypothetical protein